MRGELPTRQSNDSQEGSSFCGTVRVAMRFLMSGAVRVFWQGHYDRINHRHG